MAEEKMRVMKSELPLCKLLRVILDCYGVLFTCSPFTLLERERERESRISHGSVTTRHMEEVGLVCACVCERDVVSKHYKRDSCKQKATYHRHLLNGDRVVRALPVLMFGII